MLSSLIFGYVFLSVQPLGLHTDTIICISTECGICIETEDLLCKAQYSHKLQCVSHRNYKINNVLFLFAPSQFIVYATIIELFEIC